MVNVKKKVCLVVASPLTIRFFLLEQIRLLSQEYELVVITNTDDPDFRACHGIDAKIIPVRIERNVSIWRDIKALVRLLIVFSRERFDIVHSISPKSGLLAMSAAWMVNIAVRIHTFQGEVWVTRKGLWRLCLKFLDKLVAKWATHLLVVSFSEQNFLIEQGIAPRNKLKVLANGSICGVDTERFKPNSQARNEIRSSLNIPDTDVILLFLGRQNVDKGILELAEAFSRIFGRYSNIHLLIVGPDEEGMRGRIQVRCGHECARLHFVDYTDIPEQYMAAADILCLPSHREGFGLVLIEAAAVGIATVGSRIYGISDAIVESETGLLFTAGDVDDLTGKLEQLIGNPELRRRLGEQGYTRVRREFPKDLVLSQLLQYYRMLPASNISEITLK